ncbi:alcohol dehydrogenase GroES domain protein [Wolfiporia cocos MD-104 SS10]|uniref:Alcohol dehydrogenase GroES domain protein n=1 Tax=Wolfiporia cocos (strain MD-104) TaxID=742152 RepID=A0A2H3JB77_WOLCO|nr:alcohol dehydrogenase GroES domain protein [Wolfiporia cocos MD-104 SS10]
MATMKALAYLGKGEIGVVERPKPAIQFPTDAVVKLLKTTICGTDLHIMKGDVPTVPEGRILGHEGIGTIESAGSSVISLVPGDLVVISCITACGTCNFCRRGITSHCTSGGWILGNTVDGTQAEYVRVQFANTSLYHAPKGVDLNALVMTSDILPTSLECGVLSDSPRLLIAMDVDGNRLEAARKHGATHTVRSGPNAVKEVMDITGGLGVDSAIEAVGIPATFELCQDLVGVGETIANVGVHGSKVDLHLEELWDRNVAITARLVDAVTTPTLLQMLESGRLDATPLITHHFRFSEIMESYTTFKAAAENKALKVIIDFP